MENSDDNLRGASIGYASNTYPDSALLLGKGRARCRDDVGAKCYQ